MLSEEARAKAKIARRLAPTRKQKMAAYAETFAKQRKRFPKIALPVIDQCEQGKMAFFVKLMCLECSHWVRAEVRDCVIPWCPLYPIRPFQKLTGSNPNDSPKHKPKNHVGPDDSKLATDATESPDAGDGA